MEHWQRFLETEIGLPRRRHMRATGAYGPSSGEIVKLDSDISDITWHGDKRATHDRGGSDDVDGGE
jgi:hypothetical protein